MGRTIPIIGVQQAATQCVELDHGGSYRRYPGTIVDAPEQLRPGHECQIDLTVVPPPAIVATLNRVRVYSRCLIETAHGSLIRESLINTGETFGPYRRKGDREVEKLSDPITTPYSGGSPVVLLKQEWDRNYGHWLIESLPRVGMIAERYDIMQCRFIVGDDTGPIGAVYRDSLTRLGVPPENIVPLADGAVAFDELLYPTPITVQPWIKAPRVIRFLEALGRSMPQARPGPKRIYVTRDPKDSRRLLDEEPVLRIVTQAGYQVVSPGNLDFSAQVAAFREATHVVGILGAGLSNLAFAPRGVHLLALTSETMQDDFFWDLICHKAGTYTSLHGKAVDPAAGMRSDFKLDEKTFLRYFAAFDSTG
jgi:hypothetical protein